MVWCWKTQFQWKSPYLLWINPLPPGSRLSVEGNSYWLLLLGTGCSFILVMGKRMFLGLCEGACKGAMGSAPLDGSMRCFRGSWVVGAVQRNPSPLPWAQGSRQWPGEGHCSPEALLASLQAPGQRTKGIPAELGQLAILVLVQTVWNAHHSPELTGTVTNEAKMAGMTFPC